MRNTCIFFFTFFQQLPWFYRFCCHYLIHFSPPIRLWIVQRLIFLIPLKIMEQKSREYATSYDWSFGVVPWMTIFHRERSVTLRLHRLWLPWYRCKHQPRLADNFGLSNIPAYQVFLLFSNATLFHRILFLFQKSVRCFILTRKKKTCFH